MKRMKHEQINPERRERFSESGIATTPCPVCGWGEVIAALAPPGQREQPVFLRCCACGNERADLEFYEEPCRAA
jgi:hypothetical protein